jgi:hypothetical protein
MTKRTNRLPVFANHEDKQTIKQFADKSGLTVSTYLLKAGLNKRITSLVEKQSQLKIDLQLAKIGNNLNQIARKLNSNDDVHLAEFEAVNASFIALKRSLSNDR